MKGLLIDPFAKSISEVRINKGDTQALNEIIQCDNFTLGTYLWASTPVYVGENAFLVPEERNAYFKFLGINKFFAGRAVVLGLNDKGAPADADFTPDSLKTIVSWV